MITIINYGVGNLFSLVSSFDYIGEKAKVSSDADEILRADKLILPGVGAFSDAIGKLRDSGLDKILLEKAKGGTPVMGICLGMQLLFDVSYEYGEHRGLGLLHGSIVPITDTIPPEKLPRDLKIQHIGWNALHFPGEKAPIFKYTREGDHVYFVHSYCAVDCVDSLAATTEYVSEITAAVSRDNVCACQFHPEKSGEVGLKILKAFAEI